jgi:hypothetical protein
MGPTLLLLIAPSTGETGLSQATQSLAMMTSDAIWD